MLSHKTAKKYWLKRFSEKEVSEINDIFNLSIKLNIENEDMKKIKDLKETLLLKVGEFVYPERDIADDTLGVEPKTVKKYIVNFSMGDLKEVITMLNILLISKKLPMYETYIIRNIDEDNVIDWNKAFTQITEKMTLSPKQIIKKHFDECHVDNLVEATLLNYTIFLSSNMTEKDIFNKAAKTKAWKEFFRNAPKNEVLFWFVKPKYFDMKLLNFLTKKFFKVKAVWDLEFFDQLKLASMINIYDKSILEKIDSLILNQDIFSNKRVTKANSFILDLLGPIEGVNLGLNALNNINQETLDVIVDNIKKTKENRADFALILLKCIDKISKTKKKEEYTNLLLEFKFSQIKALYSYHFQNLEHALEFILREQSFCMGDNSEKYIKDISVTEKSYTLKVLDKNDLDRFFLGDYVDCCQTVSPYNVNSGGSCIISGNRNRYNGFFSISKKGSIYAEAWFWIGKDYNNSLYLCIDSIENLEASSAQKEIYLSLLEKFSEEVLKKYADIKYVCIGDSYRLKDKFFEEKGYLDISADISYNDQFLVDKYKSVYTDTDGEKGYKVRLIKRKKNEK